jgi:hypothetical protein
MSHRAHFWIRIVGLVAILATEFGPRLWSAGVAGNASAQGARVAAVAATADLRQP